ncbi:protein kinase domain-containing protein [Tuwongella immobilis]|uniref:non-specific serine/threonine protein kinase n=1 Tax=Tuwongella immobilis TaxID=692036 RepID=A0A6C2YPP0_9BACT|nr:protein kinase [Tuwongella immobilis]VIP03364.1 serine threonine protein kinase : Putative serine/threonine protein kinase OS=Gemmata sp. Wa1-1 PE=4 SV=1: Pkinase [Tuwongella immobilis]VTS04100.1 serine threonine protein kinase : Putative serine/threonine protein kinase OS=Gemmata sp. Wa1-1 PE=4 SV=1: Pkinase [Tuwongella immobilis]
MDSNPKSAPGSTSANSTSGDRTPDLVNQTLGDFQLLRKLGQGGMGQVYLARQLTLKRQVAVKILRAELAQNVTALRRFQAEAEAVARIVHANIVQVYAIGEQNGLNYMALEFVDGRTLRDYLVRKGTLDLPVALSIMRQVLAALARAHEMGFVHRDIKPENILISRKGEAKVTDFGLSRCFATDEPLNITQSGVTMGTPLYMSPEQVQGHAVDPRTDLYSFGVTCFHLLCGEPPFRGNTPFEVALQHVQAEPPQLRAIRPDLPDELCQLVHKLMAKRKEDRFATAKEVLRDLARIREQLGMLPGTTAPVMPLTNPASQTLQTTSDPNRAGLPAAGSEPRLGTLTGTIPSQPSSSQRRIRMLVGAVALVASGAIGFWLNEQSLRSSSPVEVSREDSAGTALPSPPASDPSASLPKLASLRERALLAELKSPKIDPVRLTQFTVELALIYVEERRLDEAEQLFRSLSRGGILPRNRLPEIGVAIVTAYRDDVDPEAAVKSAAKFLEVLGERDGKVAAVTLRGYPLLSQAIGVALQRNAENLKAQGKSLDPKLERFRSGQGIFTPKA